MHTHTLHPMLLSALPLLLSVASAFAPPGSSSPSRYIGDEGLQYIAKNFPTDKYLAIDDPNGLLEPILIPRIPDTDGIRKVQEFITDFVSTQTYSEGEVPGWDVQLDVFQEDTPIKENVTFTNILVKRDPPNAKKGHTGYITIAAHYDTLIKPTGFVGAIDSAVPCALMLYTIKAIDEAITRKWKEMKNEPDRFSEHEKNTGIQFIFFDGEEAFHSWTDTDSTYGSRHLAQLMDQTYNEVNSARVTWLAEMESLVLLDLIGHKDTYIPSFFRNTHWQYEVFASLEQRIRDIGLSARMDEKETIFTEGKPAFFRGAVIGDDHLPFLHRGVPVLHLIPSHFPPVWHTINDNAKNLHFPDISDWGLLTSSFVANQLRVGDWIVDYPDANEMKEQREKEAKAQKEKSQKANGKKVPRAPKRRGAKL